ncbi:hypothetical protein FIBSPDRAFT_1048977 [Athelia psychrophila]|uniref:Uncharacterized protein n=1 Tax=Athelia psychrophila TaxID=1759441 RepID=A0A166CX83_9AGAM|nr:hypothetical protein FIBSPDRAFT_1048977 [Fibularhizoctonia sp. CBS 109695]
MGLFRQKIVPRQFIDLMFNETGKYANWELAKRIQVGDYGEVDRETGTFVKYGNIYDDGLILNKTDKDDPMQGNSLINWNISTEAARQHHFSGTPECNAAGMVGVALTGTWEFSGQRGAVLLMHSPQLWTIPNNKLLNRLVDGNELEGKYIVSEVYACPAVSLYLSHKDDKQVTFKLHADVDPSIVALAAGAPIGLGGTVKGGWSAHNAGGNHQCAGSEKDLTGKYTPLFILKKRKWGGSYRGVPQKPISADDDKWDNLNNVPWGDLDSEGEEEEEEEEEEE